MSVLRCVIVDDQQDAIDDLVSLLEVHDHRIRIEGTARSYTEALKIISLVRPDVLFLDVELGNKTGFDILAALTKPHPITVFVSAMAHYSLRAIKVSAADYLLKPVNADELAEVIEKCSNQATVRLNLEATSLLSSDHISANYRPQRIAIRQHDTLKLIPFGNLIYVEGDSNYSRFHTTTSERITASMTLKEVEEVVDHLRFLRCHKSYLVNTDFVAEVFGGDMPRLLLKDGKSIPIARRRLKDVTQRLTEL